MPQFHYTARNASGQLIDGTVTAGDRAAAIAQVEQKRFVPIKIQLVGDDAGKAAPAAPKAAPKSNPKETSAAKAAAANEGTSAAKPESTKPAALAKPAQAKNSKPAKSDKSAEEKPHVTSSLSLNHAQQYLFSEQLAHLLSAGMTLDESLGVLSKRLKHPKLRGLSSALHQSLVDGRSLSQAMRDFPKVFTSLYVNMVSAGEASGSLPTILRRLTVYLADVKTLRDRVQSALMYPIFLALVGVALVVVFMTVMVPQLMGFFKDTSIQLPAATKLLIALNDYFTKYWWLVGAIGAGIFLLFRAFIATPPGRMTWDRFRWNIPVFSRIPRFRFYTQFARTLGTLTENGVTLLRALELLEDMTGNVYISERMREIRHAVVDGATLSRAVANRDIFPEMFVDMMAVGEQTGKFSDTMVLIADIYDRELDKQVKVVTSLLPPIVMVGIASIIGTVIYGILVAVFKLTGGMNRR